MIPVQIRNTPALKDLHTQAGIDHLCATFIRVYLSKVSKGFIVATLPRAAVDLRQEKKN